MSVGDKNKEKNLWLSILLTYEIIPFPKGFELVQVISGVYRQRSEARDSTSASSDLLDFFFIFLLYLIMN